MANRFSLEVIFKALDRFTAPMAKMERRFASSMKNLGAASRQISAITDRAAAGFARIATVGAAAGVAAGAGLVTLGKSGADFEQAMADVGAVSLLSADQLAILEKNALDLGASTRFSATEVAKGMEEMGRAGFSTQETLDGIAGMLNAAAAEGGDLAEITAIVSKTMKGMGLSMDQTTRVADVLALASAKTNSSIATLGESMANVSATARQFGVPLEDTVAAVALLQDVGLDASEAGTAVATMLTKLAAPSKEARKEMAALGVKFQDAKGNMLPLMDVFGQFEKAAKKSGGNMKTAAFFAELVGMRGQKAAINLKDLFMSGKVGDLTKDLQNAAGTAEKMANQRMNTFEGDLEQLGGAIDTVKINLFKLESGPLRNVVKGMTDWIAKNGELVASGVGKFLDDAKAALPTIGEWLDRIGRAAVPIAAVAIAMKAIALATWLWNAALAANPLTLWILGLTAAVALIAAFWPEIKEAAENIWKATKEFTSRIANTVEGFFTAAWEKIKGFMVAAAEFVVGLIVLAFKPLMPILQPTFDALGVAAQYIMGLWEPLTSFFSALWNGIKGAVSSAANYIAGVVTALYDKIRAIFAPIADWFAGVWQSIADTFNAIVGGFLARVEKVVRFIQGVGAKALGLEPPTAPEAGEAAAVPATSAGDATLREFREKLSVTEHEITVNDRTGRAEVKSPKNSGVRLSLQPSGTFAPAQ